MSIAAAAAVIRRAAPTVRPRLGIVTGSGLGGLADALADAVAVPYADIPGFPRPTVAGHAGRLVLGDLAGCPVAVLQGRVHGYEVHGYEGQGFAAWALALRCLKALGCTSLLTTCAAGALRADLMPGSLMAITDHINLMGVNPLVGPNNEAVGPRFPDMVNAWDPALRATMTEAAAADGVALAHGVYAAVMGPNFETPAEVRMLGRLGGDAVGMSTVPDCLIARHAGLRVAGLALITNHGAGLVDDAVLSHAQTLDVAAAAGAPLRRLVTAFCRRFALTGAEEA